MKTTAAAPAPSSIPDWAGLAARAAIGLLFVVSGALKASAPAEEFSVAIEAYNVLPVGMSLAFATLLPWMELLLGFALLSGYLTRPAAAAGGVLLLCFIGAIASTKIRGIELPNCGCFGSSFHPSTTTTMLLDAVLAGLALLAYKRGFARLSLDRWVLNAPKP